MWRKISNITCVMRMPAKVNDFLSKAHGFPTKINVSIVGQFGPFREQIYRVVQPIYEWVTSLEKEVNKSFLDVRYPIRFTNRKICYYPTGLSGLHSKVLDRLCQAMLAMFSDEIDVNSQLGVLDKIVGLEKTAVQGRYKVTNKRATEAG